MTLPFGRCAWSGACSLARSRVGSCTVAEGVLAGCGQRAAPRGERGSEFRWCLFLCASDLADGKALWSSSGGYTAVLSCGGGWASPSLLEPPRLAAGLLCSMRSRVDRIASPIFTGVPSRGLTVALSCGCSAMPPFYRTIHLSMALYSRFAICIYFSVSDTINQEAIL